jgi:hypothetical protein
MKMKTWINIVAISDDSYCLFDFQSVSHVILAVINSGKTQGEILTNILCITD